MSAKKKQPMALKRDINLAQTDRKGTPPKTAAAVAVCLALFVGLFCKFAVLDQLDRVWSSQRAADQAAQQLAQLRQATENYDQVLEEYQSYTIARDALSSDADPMACLDLVERYLIRQSTVKSFTVADGLISAQISGVTLHQVSDIYQDLMANDLVKSVQVYTAETEEDKTDGQVNAALTIDLTGDKTRQRGGDCAVMDREFTPREKGMLLVLAVLLLALGYMKLFYAPVQQAVEDNQQRQTELQDQALIEQTRALKMQVMEKELEELKAGNAVPDAQVPDYDNVQRVMIELNAILARAQEYSLAFDDVSLDDSGLVRRPVELTFKTADYAAAREIITDLYHCRYRCSIQDVSIYADEDGTDITAAPGAVTQLTAVFLERNDGTVKADQTDGNS